MWGVTWDALKWPCTADEVNSCSSFDGMSFADISFGTVKSGFISVKSCLLLILICFWHQRFWYVVNSMRGEGEGVCRKHGDL